MLLGQFADKLYEMTDLAKFSPQSRVWIFACTEALAPESAREVVHSLEEFVGQWKAHGKPVSGGCAVYYDRFVVVAADEAKTDVSGCSIDSLFRTVSVAVRKYGSDISDGSLVYFRKGDELVALRPDQFEHAVQNGDVKESTIVFNNNVQRLDDFLNGGWELPFGDSWHARVFRAR